MRKTEDERSSSQNGINSCSLSALWSSYFSCRPASDSSISRPCTEAVYEARECRGLNAPTHVVILSRAVFPESKALPFFLDDNSGHPQRHPARAAGSQNTVAGGGGGW